MKITRTSRLSGKERTLDLDVTHQQITRWLAGEMIQNVMPLLPRHEREFIISGITGEEWEKFFGSTKED